MLQWVSGGGRLIVVEGSDVQSSEALAWILCVCVGWRAMLLGSGIVRSM